MYFSANSAAESHIIIECHSVRSGIFVPSGRVLSLSFVANLKLAIGRVSI